jgi:hypothetical protein
MRWTACACTRRLSTTEAQRDREHALARLHEQRRDDRERQRQLDDELGPDAGTVSTSTRPLSRSIDFSTTSSPTPRPDSR